MSHLFYSHKPRLGHSSTIRQMTFLVIPKPGIHDLALFIFWFHNCSQQFPIYSFNAIFFITVVLPIKTSYRMDVDSLYYQFHEKFFDNYSCSTKYTCLLGILLLFFRFYEKVWIFNFTNIFLRFFNFTKFCLCCQSRLCTGCWFVNIILSSVYCSSSRLSYYSPQWAKNWEKSTMDN